MTGNWHSPQAGAFTRSVELARVAVVDLVPELPFVTTEEASDSTEPLLSVSEELFLVGRGGGGLRTGNGGGAGLFPTRACVTVTEPFVFSGGLLKVFALGRSGRLVGICGAGLGGSPGIRPM